MKQQSLALLSAPASGPRHSRCLEEGRATCNHQQRRLLQRRNACRSGWAAGQRSGTSLAN